MTDIGIILPSQRRGLERSHAPEYRLMIAVLMDALECLEKYRSATDRHGQQVFNETRDWLSADENEWLYSFEHICGVLDLDSTAVRRRLMAKS